MNKPENSQSTTSEQGVHERCPCREIVDTVQAIPGDFACCPAALDKLARRVPQGGPGDAQRPY